VPARQINEQKTELLAAGTVEALGAGKFLFAQAVQSEALLLRLREASVIAPVRADEGELRVARRGADTAHPKHCLFIGGTCPDRAPREKNRASANSLAQKTSPARGHIGRGLCRRPAGVGGAIAGRQLAAITRNRGIAFPQIYRSMPRCKLIMAEVGRRRTTGKSGEGAG
jgi:hypothetical protein